MNNTPPSKQWVIAFRWNYNSNLINKKISKQEAGRENLNGYMIRIGRADPCNLKLEDNSVSSEHAEIYFNEQQEKFFIKTLAPKNITKVDGRVLVYGEELPLNKNSTVVLGRQEIEVTDIQIFEIELTNYSGIVNPAPISSAVNSTPKLNESKHWWQEPTTLVALIGTMGTLAGLILTWWNNKESLKTEKEKQQIQIYADKEKEKNQFNLDRQKEYLKYFNEHLDKVRDLKKNKKGEFNQLTLENSNCPNPVRVAVSFVALDDKQETKGWYFFERGVESKTTGAITDLAGLNLYAETTDMNEKLIKWEPPGKTFITKSVKRDKEFTYIQEPFINSDISNKDEITEVKFYNLDFLKNSTITRKAFDCSAKGTLKLVDAIAK